MSESPLSLSESPFGSLGAGFQGFSVQGAMAQMLPTASGHLHPTLAKQLLAGVAEALQRPQEGLPGPQGRFTCVG